jgi:hypothetical protein
MPGRPDGLRALMQSSAAAKVKEVWTAREWYVALFSGVEHIELRAHIDSSEGLLAPLDNISGTLPPNLKSVRVRHTSPAVSLCIGALVQQCPLHPILRGWEQ